MKNLKKIIGLIVMVFILSGCVNIESNMKISMNKKMDFEIIFSMDRSMLEENEIYKEELLDDKQKEELISKGFEIKKYNENNQIGNIITKKFDNIDYLSSVEDINYDLESVINDPLSTAYIFKYEKGFLKNKYIANYDLNNEDLSTDISSSLFNVSFNVSLPYKALESNATTVDNNGKLLKWDLSKANKSIQFTFEIYNIINVVAVVLAITIVVLLTLNFILTMFAKIADNKNNKVDKKKKDKKEKKKQDNNSNNNEHRFIMSLDDTNNNN